MSYKMSCEFGKFYRFLAGAGCVGYLVFTPFSGEHLSQQG